MKIREKQEINNLYCYQSMATKSDSNKVECQGGELKVTAAIALGYDLIKDGHAYDKKHLVDKEAVACSLSKYEGGLLINDRNRISWAQHIRVRELCTEIYSNFEKAGIVIGRCNKNKFQMLNVKEWNRYGDAVVSKWETGSTDDLLRNLVTHLVCLSFRNGRKEWNCVE